MFDFLRKSGVRRPSGAIRRAIEADGLPADTDVERLGVVETGGIYSGRKVTYFRVFDPSRAASHGADVFKKLDYHDLDAHPDLVLRAGFAERDGTVVVFARRAPVDAAVTHRDRADRSLHADDERVVFPDRERPGGGEVGP